MITRIRKKGDRIALEWRKDKNSKWTSKTLNAEKLYKLLVCPDTKQGIVSKTNEETNKKVPKKFSYGLLNEPTKDTENLTPSKEDIDKLLYELTK